MREITLQPGTSIEIDGVIVRAASQPAVAQNAQDCAPSEEIFVSPETILMLRESVTRWISTGDLSQKHLLRGAIAEAARNISRIESAFAEPRQEEIAPSSPPRFAGRPE